MLKRPFFKLSGPRLYYSTIKEDASIEEISLPSRAIILLEKNNIRPTELYGYIGKMVKTGERIDLSQISFTSPVTGHISQISEYIGYLNKEYYSLSIDTVEDEWVKIPEGYMPISIPGFKNIAALFGFSPPINHVMIMGMDTDLFVTTNQLALRKRMDDIKKGITYIHKIANIGDISFIIPSESVSYVKDTGYSFYITKRRYPYNIPKLILKDIFKQIPAPGKEPADMGIGFVSSEAMANLGSFMDGRPVFDKLITVINKDYSTIHIKSRVGTPIGYILNQLDIDISDGDRIAIGGPMRGRTIYSLDTPVEYDTDAIFIQDRNEIIHSSDTHCINCGECVKVCPVNVPVNMLVRVLANALFEEAVNEYDLLSCIECGLCSYVCIARIPVFHYIMLGKHEFFKMR